ncbi:Sec-C motif domain protein [Polaribacter sejongensis]|uniref:Sec-C motif domain protein n=1 Tax=Polaribacter sejongensis TaxID=985043 RepID=A0ABN5F7N2_9FLAO|nr:YchJ family metal-binding protein [Polaribacter sejongensis]AUC23537.1 Sec-C motif domain protein [Polaribacter sejongensis]
MKCPCNPSKLYKDCCKKAHQNIHSVTTPEILMRSRYSAFVMANIDYLQKSHHSSTRPSNFEKKEILAWTKSVEWLKLNVLQSTENTVEFKAFFYENSSLNVIHENSLFVKENDHWVYKSAL